MIGALKKHYGGEIPNGYLLCDGRQLLIDEYRPLFYLLGSECGKIENGKFFLPKTKEGLGFEYLIKFEE